MKTAQKLLQKKLNVAMFMKYTEQQVKYIKKALRPR